MNMASNFSTLAIGGHPNSGLSLNAPYRVRQELITNFCPHQTGAQPLHHGPSNQSNDDEDVMAQ
jgi:hypothetical protein